MATSQHTFFALQDVRTGALARLTPSDLGHGQSQLSDDDSLPVFEAASLDQLSDVLLENTMLMNTHPECPSWGPFRREHLAPVEVTVVTKIEPACLPPSRCVAKTLEVRKIPSSVAQSYAQKPVSGTECVFWLVELPACESLESVQAWVGQVVRGGDKWTKRRLHAAVAVPEEYVAMTNGKPAALFLASGLVA